METIEQAKDRLELTMDGKNGFYRGVLWAQQWIDIEEELPSNISSVLVRDDGFSPIRSLALFQDGKFYPDFLLTHDQVTHWRPIEIK